MAGVGYVGGFKYGLPTFAPPKLNPTPGYRASYINGLPSYMPIAPYGSVPYSSTGQNVNSPRITQAAPALAAPAIDWSKLLAPAEPAPTATVSSGVQAGPVYSQGQTDSAWGRYGAMKPQGGNPTANAMYGQMAQEARTGTGRMMAQANANQQLGSETARATTGLGWGRQSAGDAIAADGFKQRKNQQVLTLLSALGVM